MHTYAKISFNNKLIATDTGVGYTVIVVGKNSYPGGFFPSSFV